MSKEKIYTITITEKELNILKNDINIKSMLGKLKWDSAVIIRHIIHDTDKQCKGESMLHDRKKIIFEDRLNKAKDENKKTEESFFNSLLNICILNGLVDWSDKDPKKEFADIGKLLIIYMKASGIEFEDINKDSAK